MIFTGQDLVFNGFNFSELVHVEHIRTQLTPSISYASQTIPGRTGVRLGKRQVGARVIEVDIRMIETSRADVTDVATVIAGRLITDGVAKLVTRRDRDRWWMALYQGSPDLEQFYDTGFATLEFLAPGGAMYSDEVTAPLADGASVLAAQGTYESSPVIELSLAGAVVEASAMINGQRVMLRSYSGAWPIGTVIEIDMDARLVRINGEPAQGAIQIGSRFGKLLPGSNQVVLVGGPGEIRYFPRWL